MDDSAEVLFQSSLQEAIVSSSYMGRDVHVLTLSIQDFPCRPQHRPQRALKDGFEDAVVQCDMPDHGPTLKLILLRTHSLVLCSK